MPAPSSLCLDATFSTRTWLKRKRLKGIEPSSDDILHHITKHWPALRDREVEYVLQNHEPVKVMYGNAQV